MHASLSLDVHNKTITHLGVKALMDFYRLMAIEKYEHLGVEAILTGSDSPFLNVVIQSHIPQLHEVEAIKATIAFFEKRQVPWTWFINPLSEPANLSTFLVKHKFELIEEAPSMVCDLSRILPKMKIKGFEIEEIFEGSLKEWIKPINEGFPGGEEPGNDQFLLVNERILQNSRNLRQFIARFQGEVVCAGSLFVGLEATMIHNVATKSAYRKRGFGTVLTQHLMFEAQTLGFRHCFLDPSPSSYQLYRRLGFKNYCISRYYARGKRA